MYNFKISKISAKFGLIFVKITTLYHSFDFEKISTVEPLKTDTPRDRPKCPSYGGVRLIEVLKSVDIRQKELQFQLIVVG